MPWPIETSFFNKTDILDLEVQEEDQEVQEDVPEVQEENQEADHVVVDHDQDQKVAEHAVLQATVPAKSKYYDSNLKSRRFSKDFLVEKL